MTSLSTHEVAALIDVTETTVKRWADTGKLACYRTVGGHRKFLMSDVVQFAEQYAYPVNGTVSPPLSERGAQVLEFAVQQRDFGKIVRVFFSALSRADRQRIRETLSYLYRQRFSLAVLADEILKPAMARIGELWKEGSLEISQEHLVSNALLESLIQLRPELHRKPANGLSVVCACAEGEFHEFGLRLLAYALETEGFAVQYLGANTPAETLLAFIKKSAPDVVCVSVKDSPGKTQKEAWLKTVGKAARAANATYIVGGLFPDENMPEDLHCDRKASSVSETINFLRDRYHLKPGPKKQQ